MKKLAYVISLILLLGSTAKGVIYRVMPLGDSITHGWYSGISTDLNSYRKELKNLLSTNGYAIDFVGSLTDGDFADNQHEGHDGWFADHDTQTNTILSHITGWMASTPADIVLLHIGTNDINSDNADAQEVSDILDAIYAANSNTTVVLALIINTQTNYSKRADISTYNSNLTILAETRIDAGDDLIVVDMENDAGLDYTSSDMADTLHPSQIGYDKMATNWYPSVFQAIERQQAKFPRPHIDSVTVSDSSVVLGIGNLSTGMLVEIEQTHSLTSSLWSPAGTFIPSTLTTNWTSAMGESNTFYRIVVP